MSASPALFTKLTSLPRGVKASHGLTVKPFLAGRCLKRSPLHEVCVRNPVRVNRRHILTGFTPKPVMEWQDCRASVEVDVPCSVAYDFYSDREAFPTWMPMISSVKVLKDKPDLSEWTLAYEFFGRDYSFSWLARNLQPIPNQKIHWRSLDGLPNRGAVRFFPRGPSSCKVELTVSYEVPQVLSPFAMALRPFMESLLQRGLDRFASQVKKTADSPKS
ncbi:uncharacterized protein LOC116255328 isoform X1 [Nymphaea colorata]|nr:uncharacterized protein LOC116255328 isoform X1 [Nymphaea colorata]